jgi:hypothetical protein
MTCGGSKGKRRLIDATLSGIVVSEEVVARKVLRDRQAGGKAVMENALLQALKARGLYVIRNGENRGAGQKAIGIFLRATIVVAVVSVVLHVRRVGLRP